MLSESDRSHFFVISDYQFLQCIVVEVARRICSIYCVINGNASKSMGKSVVYSMEPIFQSIAFVGSVKSCGMGRQSGLVLTMMYSMGFNSMKGPVHDSPTWSKPLTDSTTWNSPDA